MDLAKEVREYLQRVDVDLPAAIRRALADLRNQEARLKRAKWPPRRVGQAAAFTVGVAAWGQQRHRLRVVSILPRHFPRSTGRRPVQGTHQSVSGCYPLQCGANAKGSELGSRSLTPRSMLHNHYDFCARNRPRKLRRARTLCLATCFGRHSALFLTVQPMWFDYRHSLTSSV